MTVIEVSSQDTVEWGETKNGNTIGSQCHFKTRSLIWKFSSKVKHDYFGSVSFFSWVYFVCVCIYSKYINTLLMGYPTYDPIYVYIKPYRINQAFYEICTGILQELRMIFSLAAIFKDYIYTNIK